MTIEKFLSFWSQYNTAIIEGLIALVIILSLFLAFRSFFAKKDKDVEAGGGQGLDAAQLEKTLQKILENQNVTKSSRGSAPASEDLGMDVDLEEMEREPVSGGGAVMESAAEVQQLRVTVNESHQKIETLQKQLKEALQSAEAAAAAASEGGGDSGGAASGLSEQEKNELSGKIRDLEARLAEYEIISEDIADLSRYRDENEQLKKDLAVAKGGGSVAAAPAPTPTPEPTPVAATEPAVSEQPEPAAPVAPAVAEAAPPAPAAPAEDAASSDLIDDDLMKEFAAAVEGQKSLSKVAEKAGDGSEAGKSNEDADKLMNEFENFVSKKS